MTRRLLAALALFTVVFGAAQATAQTYPNRPIRVVVPSTPGSPTDVMARLVAQSLTTTLGQNVFVEPRPGGGGIIGTKTVIAAEPDGYTLLFTEGAKHLMTPALYDSVGFDPAVDITPVATAGGGSFVLVVSSDLPVKSVQELADYARAHPGKINFGFGQGTLPHMLGETLKHTAKIDITSVPYKGGAQAVADMLGGHIQMNFGTTATLLSLIKQGKLRALAVTNDRRLAEIPDVPTMAESGFPNLTLRYWMALWAPPHTPAAIVEKLNADVIAGLKSPELEANMAKAGFEPMPMDVKAMADFVAAESPKWLAVAKTSGVRGD
ncbi:Bug family tripartite tricarboxylate transporter substrate binding protein [Rhodoplanes sp. Z2-YC6860]|uniref:Bug family tripartite tricarboxylate transporter substrate binding protein n=1 Tax=Rhodoplanes sp. Z2-YC6860 TaxID=674703 RepID=UPI00078CCD19|nr:tripartite tricarboxylate transporter substrate-binding protein [Rhodoplanes sp. Z2-YC6860]AMN40360.1 ABC transporter substrate-binding protein [Rhodoplanes sp. Z2-YC6860]